MNILIFVSCTQLLIGGFKVLPGSFSLPCVWIISGLVPWAWTLFPLVPILNSDLWDFPGWSQSKCTAHWFFTSSCPFLFISTVTTQVHIVLTTSNDSTLQIVLSASFLAYLVFSLITRQTFKTIDQLMSLPPPCDPCLKLIYDFLGSVIKCEPLCCSHFNLSPAPTHHPSQVPSAPSWSDPMSPQGLCVCCLSDGSFRDIQVALMHPWWCFVWSVLQSFPHPLALVL